MSQKSSNKTVVVQPSVEHPTNQQTLQWPVSSYNCYTFLGVKLKKFLQKQCLFSRLNIPTNLFKMNNENTNVTCEVCQWSCFYCWLWVSRKRLIMYKPVILLPVVFSNWSAYTRLYTGKCCLQSLSQWVLSNFLDNKLFFLIKLLLQYR